MPARPCGFAPGRSADISGSKIRFAPKGETATAMTENSRSIALTVNGEDVRETVEVRTSLVDFLRERLGLTGSHVGCEQGVCGACTVRLDDVTVRGCLVLAVQCAGSRVETIEGVSDTGEIGDLQEAFVRRNALQCGFCTPGMLLAAQELLARGGVPSREEIRAHLSGNYCRCTGYQAIVDAVEAVAMARRSYPSPSSGRAGVGSFPRQERAARAPTLPSAASGGGLSAVSFGCG
jgi:carbon-monoxide dehydrogenase small subunit